MSWNNRRRGGADYDSMLALSFGSPKCRISLRNWLNSEHPHGWLFYPWIFLSICELRVFWGFFSISLQICLTKKRRSRLIQSTFSRLLLSWRFELLLSRHHLWNLLPNVHVMFITLSRAFKNLSYKIGLFATKRRVFGKNELRFLQPCSN